MEDNFDVIRYNNKGNYYVKVVREDQEDVYDKCVRIANNRLRNKYYLYKKEFNMEMEDGVKRPIFEYFPS